MMDTGIMQEHIGELCCQFRLPTMEAQSVSRFTAADHGGALPVFLEVLEREAEDRNQRRINRLRKESRLPSGKTWETFEHDRMPMLLRQQFAHSLIDLRPGPISLGSAGVGLRSSSPYAWPSYDVGESAHALASTTPGLHPCQHSLLHGRA